mgnify:CR=1 FL=1
MVDGTRVEAPLFGLSPRHRLDLLKLTLHDEEAFTGKRIDEHFDEDFFGTHFWTMWCTMFAFRRWHSVAEMRRFMHLLPGFNRLEGIHRTRLNQYDSIVRPVIAWLQDHGVRLHLDSPVTDLSFAADGARVDALHWRESGVHVEQPISAAGRVFVTLGSMTEASTLRPNSSPPRYQPGIDNGSWQLWRRIADVSPKFGNPERFCGDVSLTSWESFTVTLRDGRFFDLMEHFTGNRAGTGGLVTFKHSGWLLSVVLAHQPHFEGQPDETHVFWGYGLHPERDGDAVAKPMYSCNGDEILEELAHHLRLPERAGYMFEDAVCIPCVMPHITAQFMPRYPGDRPAVLPVPRSNFAFLGQFCEMPDDTVFTVEYSVRSAQTAVYGLYGVGRDVTPLYRGFEDPSVKARALLTLSTNGRELPR